MSERGKERKKERKTFNNLRASRDIVPETSTFKAIKMRSS
jgi:hypothetical protein